MGLLFGLPAICIAGILIWVFRSFGSLAERGNKRYGDTKSIHEMVKNTGRQALYEAAGEDEEAAGKIVEGSKKLAVEGMKAAGKALWLGTKGVAKGAHELHQLYFNTEEALPKWKKRWDAVEKSENARKEDTDRKWRAMPLWQRALAMAIGLGVLIAMLWPSAPKDVASWIDSYRYDNAMKSVATDLKRLQLDSWLKPYTVMHYRSSELRRDFPFLSADNLTCEGNAKRVYVADVELKKGAASEWSAESLNAAQRASQAALLQCSK